ncbi:MAG: ImmA/IrrE family metallo-endopeptidase [Clostridia bacterium]|nr:ImmA/IrrE family metallo-endopeptidase [Clostridia bacterium]
MKTRLPEKPRTERSIKAALEFLVRENICWLPVDAKTLLNHYISEVKTVGELSSKLDISRAEVIGGKNADLFFWNGKYKMIYDETVHSPERIRWTFMHEIAHVLLGHLEDFDRNSLLSNLTSKEYTVLEREADIFTIEVIAPFLLLRKLRISHWTHIMDVCKTSETASKIREKEMKKNNFKGIYLAYEERILTQFDFYLRNVKTSAFSKMNY